MYIPDAESEKGIKHENFTKKKKNSCQSISDIDDQNIFNF